MYIYIKNSDLHRAKTCRQKASTSFYKFAKFSAAGLIGPVARANPAVRVRA